MNALFATLRRHAGQLARYGGLAALSACISVFTPVILHEGLGVDERIAVAAGLLLAFLANFLGLQSFVFRQRGGAGANLARFVGVSLAFRLFEYGFFLLLFDGLGLPYMPALLVPLFVSFSLKFVTYKLFVFRAGA